MYIYFTLQFIAPKSFSVNKMSRVVCLFFFLFEVFVDFGLVGFVGLSRVDFVLLLFKKEQKK